VGKKEIVIVAVEPIKVRPGEMRLELPMPKILGEVVRRSNPATVSKLHKTLSSGCTLT
jgi:hypothetical protein